MKKRKTSVTSWDVARRAGVSRTTVSLVLNKVKGTGIREETRKRVLAAADELGYVPHAAAQALASRRTQILGLVFSPTYHHMASHAFLLQVIEGLMEVAREHDLRLLIDSVGERMTRMVKSGRGQNGHGTYLALARAKRIDGLVLLEPRFDDPELPLLVEEEFPAVLIGRHPKVPLCSVDIDNRAAARAAVEHLLSLGHQRIACITNAPLTYTAAAERLQGYREALEAASLPYDERLIRIGAFTPESGFHAMSSLLELGKERPTAVFIASDVVALGSLAALRARGLKVPEDLAVVGFDDVPLARFVEPPLTTVHVPAVDEGRKAGELLLDLLQGRAKSGCQVTLPAKLIIRASSGQPQGRTTTTNDQPAKEGRSQGRGNRPERG